VPVERLTQGIWPARILRITPPCVLSNTYQYLETPHFDQDAVDVIKAASESRRLYCLHVHSPEVMAAIHWDWAPPELHPRLHALTLHAGALDEPDRAAVVRGIAMVALRTAQYMAASEGLGSELRADMATIGVSPHDLRQLGFESVNSHWVLPEPKGGKMTARFFLTWLKNSGVLR
jgi:hypothetical protein